MRTGWTRTELAASIVWHTILVGLATLTLTLACTTPAHAIELGISDDKAPLEQRNTWATAANMRWERFVVSVGQPGVAQRIRDAHTAGRKVILTVGGIGTRTRRPSFTRALRYIATLPRAERYTIDNEPMGDGTRPCTYLRGWRKARRVLGERLLFGDLDPFFPLEYIAKMTKCRGQRLPANVGLAIHPYDRMRDPLTPGIWQGGLGNLRRLQRALRGMGMHTTVWITELGLSVGRSTEDGVMARIGSLDPTSDAQAAWWWPRAIQQARRVHAKVLVIYTAQGHSWDTRPGPEAWAAIRGAV